MSRSIRLAHGFDVSHPLSKTDLTDDGLIIPSNDYVTTIHRNGLSISVSFEMEKGGWFITTPESSSAQFSTPPSPPASNYSLCCTSQYALSCLSALMRIATKIIVLFQQSNSTPTNDTYFNHLVNATLGNKIFSFYTALHEVAKALVGTAPVTIRRVTNNPVFFTPRTDIDAQHRLKILQLLPKNDNRCACLQDPSYLLPVNSLNSDLKALHSVILAALFAHPKLQEMFKAQQRYGHSLPDDWQEKLKRAKKNRETRFSCSRIRATFGFISWIVSQSFWIFGTHGSAQNFWPKIFSVLNLNPHKKTTFILGWITSFIFIIGLVPAIAFSCVRSFSPPPPWECAQNKSGITCRNTIIMDILTSAIILIMMVAYSLPMLAAMPTIVNCVAASFHPDGKIPDKWQLTILSLTPVLQWANVINYLLNNLLTGQLGRALLSSPWRASLCFGSLTKGICSIKKNILETSGWSKKGNRCHKYAIFGLSLFLCVTHACQLTICSLIMFRNSLHHLDRTLSLNGTFTQEHINLPLSSLLSLLYVSIQLDWADKQTYYGLTTLAYYLVVKADQILCFSKRSLENADTDADAEGQLLSSLQSSESPSFEL